MCTYIYILYNKGLDKTIKNQLLLIYYIAMSSIKEFGPNKKSRYNQTYINPKSCHKLFESLRNQPIICRSSWEKIFINWLENSSKVKAWGSECIKVPYYNPVDKKEHSYYPDFCVELVDGEKWIVEIKPYNQTQIPKNNNSWAWHEFARNTAKWTAVKSECLKKGYKFYILTEKTISKLV